MISPSGSTSGKEDRNLEMRTGPSRIRPIGRILFSEGNIETYITIARDADRDEEVRGGGGRGQDRIYYLFPGDPSYFELAQSPEELQLNLCLVRSMIAQAALHQDAGARHKRTPGTVDAYDSPSLRKRVLSIIAEDDRNYALLS